MLNLRLFVPNALVLTINAMQSQVVGGRREQTIVQSWQHVRLAKNPVLDVFLVCNISAS